MDREVDGITVPEETQIQNFDKIGEKLSQHSKHNSFIYGENGPCNYYLF